MEFEVSGNIVDIFSKRIYKGCLTIKNGKVLKIQECDVNDSQYILPGFIDAHVHIESSMLVPSEFARLAVVHGTVATVSDPHEIGNVLGMEGVKFMIENGSSVPFKFYFGAPSCVPATNYETAGATVTASEIEVLFEQYQVKYLAEMMNWPGVIFGDKEVYDKIEIAKRHNKPIDGHAPGLKGETAKKYISAGISTDHECFTKEEALDKLVCGMKILIREGSAAKNFEALIDILHDYEDKIMFCSDDKHPDNLVEGHINDLVKRALNKGVDLFKVLKAACVNPAEHYNLEVGLLREDDPADFIIVDNLIDFTILATYVEGLIVAEKGKTLILPQKINPINKFNVSLKSVDAFKLQGTNPSVKVIEALDGQLFTNSIQGEVKVNAGFLESNPEQDILKLTVVNRYHDTPSAIAFIKNFGLKSGALASSIAHDSHNIICVGVDDESILHAVNEVISNKGGIAICYNNKLHALPLPIGGLMSGEDGYKIAASYTELDKISKSMGSSLKSPFMTLSFMALLVIPSLKLSDLGLFDGDKFEFVGIHS